MSAFGGARALHVRLPLAFASPSRARTSVSAASCLAGVGSEPIDDQGGPAGIEDTGMAVAEAARVGYALRLADADPEMLAYARLSVTEPEASDLATLERQIGYRPYPVGVGARCVHGFPQAFAWDPLARQTGERSRRAPVDSGLFRLSCPLLVKAIDEWEAEGAVVNLNREVEADDIRSGRVSGPMRTELIEANRLHAIARRALVGERAHELARVLDAAPPPPPPRRKRTGAPWPSMRPTMVDMVDMVLGSGVAGQSPAKAEVKCLHAQVADHLCRSQTNPMGARVLEGVATRGYATQGDASCRGQCDCSVAPEAAAFWYVPVKNKSKLKTQLERRRVKNALEREASARADASADGIPDSADPDSADASADASADPASADLPADGVGGHADSLAADLLGAWSAPPAPAA